MYTGLGTAGFVCRNRAALGDSPAGLNQWRPLFGRVDEAYCAACVTIPRRAGHPYFFRIANATMPLGAVPAVPAPWPPLPATLEIITTYWRPFDS